MNGSDAPRCTTMDQLVALQEALEWDGVSLVQHVAACPVCLPRLRHIAVMHDAVRHGEPVPPGFGDQLLHAMLAERGQGTERPVDWPTPVSRPINARLAAIGSAVLAGATTMVGLSPLRDDLFSVTGASGVAGAWNGFSGSLLVAALAGLAVLIAQLRGARATGNVDG